ncbi:MAG: ABC transporter permease [Anaerolineae bacterium]|nr:ABC transporter permease [Anaerolineae bacterium]
MGEILRNMARRKLRTTLTIVGIVIGILALTVMGSMSEYFNTLIDNAITLLGNNIVVTPESNDFESVLTTVDERRVRRIGGVKEVVPIANDTLEEFSGISFGIPAVVYGVPPEHSGTLFPSVTLKEGRWLQRGDDYQAVVGSQLAKKRKLALGSVIPYRDHELTVVGILNETQTTPDNIVMVSLETVRRLLKAPDIIAAIYVLPEDPATVDLIAQRIRETVDNVQVYTPAEAAAQAQQALAVFNVILVGGAVLAVFVGGLAVINTMIMSVNERRHEIGLKKAVGASDGEIVREFVFESAVIGFLGGAIGLLLGWGLASLLNLATSEAMGGSSIFNVTPRLMIIAVAFAVVLGMIAGLYPAWNAARLDPVKALRVDS